MSNLIYVSLLFVCFLVMLSVSFKLDDSWDGSEEYPAAVAQRRPAELKPPTADDESKKSNMGKGRAYTKKLGPRVRSLRVYPVTPKRIIRNFADDAVLCFPSDLRAHFPHCECCGGWKQGQNGLACGIGTGFDCTEEYKLTRFRKAESSYPW